MAGTPDNYGLDKTYTADSRLARYVVVLYGDIDYHVKKPTADGDAGIAGITQESCNASGDLILIRKEGISKAVASEAISKGVEVAIDYINATTDGGRIYDPTVWASGDGVVGTLEQAAAASGDIVDCWLRIRTLLG